jgi:hypothetical protein
VHLIQAFRPAINFDPWSGTTSSLTIDKSILGSTGSCGRFSGLLLGWDSAAPSVLHTQKNASAISMIDADLILIDFIASSMFLPKGSMSFALFGQSSLRR